MNNKEIARRIALTVAWFLLVFFVVTILTGCATNNVQPEFQDLLFEEDSRDLARESVTAEDYIIKEEC